MRASYPVIRLIHVPYPLGQNPKTKHPCRILKYHVLSASLEPQPASQAHAPALTQTGARLTWPHKASQLRLRPSGHAPLAANSNLAPPPPLQAGNGAGIGTAVHPRWTLPGPSATAAPVWQAPPARRCTHAPASTAAASAPIVAPAHHAPHAVALFAACTASCGTGMMR